MTAVYVHTQEELDAALANPDYTYASHKIIIDSPADVWLTIKDSQEKDVRAGDNVTVLVGGSATVRAWGNATVEAWGNATVEAWGNATVEAWGNVTVRAEDNVTVVAWDNAAVEAWGNATVEAWDDTTVVAWGNVTVRAGGNATVEAWDDTTVRVGGSATVRAWDDTTVEAGTVVMVSVFSQKAIISGGVIIDMTTIDTTGPVTWCGINLVKVDGDGNAHLFKAVDNDLNAGHNFRLTNYPIGGTVDDTEHWIGNNMCGNGLHASPTPWLAKKHFSDATRFLEVTCPVESLRPIDDTKAKAPRFEVLREVDLHGNEVAQ